MKKSKFLKKSLAMLLALMLVVAMIPFSASAALPDDLFANIYVNGSKVSVGENGAFKADVPKSDPNVTIGTVDALASYGYVLRAQKVGSDDSQDIDQYTSTDKGTPISLANYAKDNVITLELYATDNPQRVVKSYTLTVNPTSKSTLTEVASVVPGKGVVSATIDNTNKIINVVLGRHNMDSAMNADVQEDLDAKITVTAAYNGKVDGSIGSVTVGADDGDKFTVTSESNGNNCEFVVKATYQDAFESFTVNGVDAVISDGNKDNIPDTITVTLPKSAILDSEGFAQDNPTYKVEYKVKGNAAPNVYIALGKRLTTFEDYDSIATGKTFTFTGLGASANDGAISGHVIVDRLGPTSTNGSYTDTGAIQHYDLVVKLEDSTNTDIIYAQVNRTEATVDLENHTIVAELPANVNTGSSTPTDPTDVDVVLFTAKDVDQIVLDGKTLSVKDDTVTNEDLEGVFDHTTYYSWKFTGIDLSSAKTASVTAEHSSAVQHYTVSAYIAEDVSAARITGFHMVDPATGYDAVGEIDTKELVITVTVPYMTVNVADWRVYATATTAAKVVYDNGTEEYDVVNGWHTGSNIGLSRTIDVNNGLTWGMNSGKCLRAVAKNDETVKTEYQVKVVLAPATTGHALKDMDFTAQVDDNDNDRVVSRAKNDENTFDVEVGQLTNENYVAVTMQVPPSLQTNDEKGGFNNIITNIATENNEGVVFGVTARGSDNLAVKQLTCLSSNVDNQNLNADCLVDFSDPQNYTTVDSDNYYFGEILVLPEEYARKVLTGTASDNGDGYISIANVTNHGTLYRVRVEDKKAETGTELKSFVVGGVELTINEDDEIVGTIPWSASAASDKDFSNGEWATFELSKYARLVDFGSGYGTAVYNSKGDTNGDGISNDVDSDNMQFLFVRNPDHTVTVYRTDGGSAATIDGLVVEAEDRLLKSTNNGEFTSCKYTFNLKWAEPCKEAEITSFKIGNWTGNIKVVDTTHRTIDLSVPYGTDVTGLIAEFTTSTGATVRINNSVGGIVMVSNETSVNYTNPVKLYVTSEAGDKVTEYTVTIDEGISFSDVSQGAWYFENVMDAAENGYVSGYEDGTFKPTKAITRAEFASMIANALHYEQNPNAEPAFPDVADNFWGKAAINFCAQNGIISGYEDGTFQPNKIITRQEAAAILNNAFELVEKSSTLYPDDAKIAGWAKDHVYAAKAAGLMKGDAGTGNFRPTSSITRAEAASIVMNAKNADMIK